MKGYVDKKLCIGCGLCSEIAPCNFRLEEDYTSLCFDEIKQENEELVMEAKESCPVGAIEIN